jgi:multisubunit Na+/H+ antiporter MnhE subunit
MYPGFLNIEMLFSQYIVRWDELVYVVIFLGLLLGLASSRATASLFPHYFKMAEIGLLVGLFIAYLLSWIIFKIIKSN